MKRVLHSWCMALFHLFWNIICLDSVTTYKRLQYVQKTAAWRIEQTGKYDPITHIRIALLRLLVKRICEFKMLVQIYKAQENLLKVLSKIDLYKMTLKTFLYLYLYLYCLLYAHSICIL